MSFSFRLAFDLFSQMASKCGTRGHEAAVIVLFRLPTVVEGAGLRTAGMNCPRRQRDNSNRKLQAHVDHPCVRLHATHCRDDHEIQAQTGTGTIRVLTTETSPPGGPQSQPSQAPRFFATSPVDGAGAGKGALKRF
jgi:hypothetical protein